MVARNSNSDLSIGTHTAAISSAVKLNRHVRLGTVVTGWSARKALESVAVVIPWSAGQIIVGIGHRCNRLAGRESDTVFETAHVLCPLSPRLPLIIWQSAMARRSLDTFKVIRIL
jgi:hypothetical protein